MSPETAKAEKNIAAAQAKNVLLFESLSSVVRLKIIRILNESGEVCVSDICKRIKMSSPAISHHLSLMRLSGLIDFHRRGKQNFYFVNSELFESLAWQVQGYARNPALVEREKTNLFSGAQPMAKKPAAKKPAKPAAKPAAPTKPAKPAKPTKPTKPNQETA